MATKSVTPTSTSQQSDTFQLSESFENQLNLDPTKTLGVKKQNSIKAA